MGTLQPPDAFDFKGNIAVNWITWRQSFNYFMTATEAEFKSDKVKTSMLLTCIGKEGRKIYKSFEFENEDDRINLETVLQKFDAYFEQRTSLLVSRYNFFTHRQVEGQPFSDFVAELKRLCDDCDFSNPEDLLRDMIVVGTVDNSLRHRMFCETDIDLIKVIEIGLANEQKEPHDKGHPLKQNILSQDQVNIPKQVCPGKEKGHDLKDLSKQDTDSDLNDVLLGVDKEDGANQVFSESDLQENNHVGLITDCKCCGGVHPVRKCPAYGQKCNLCKQLNHVTRYCPIRNNVVIDDLSQCYSPHAPLGYISRREVFYIENNRIQTEKFKSSCMGDIEDDLVMDDKQANRFNWSICLETNGTPIKFKIDSRAQVNILPRNIYNRLNSLHPFSPSSVSVASFDKKELPVDGKCILPVTYKNRQHQILFIVVKSKTTPIFSLDTYERLDLVRRSSKIKRRRSHSFVKQYVDVFSEVIDIEKKYHINLKNDVEPVIARTRYVPISLEDKLREKLSRMESLGIIERVRQPNGWVNELVCIENEHNELTVSLNTRPLNKIIERKHPLSLTVAEVIREAVGAELYSKLVAASVADQIKLDEESSDLLTFTTQFGFYRFKKLPSGIHPGNNIFEAEVTKMVQDLDQVAIIQNEIIVWGDTKESHDANLTNILARIRKSGLKLDYKRCIFGSRKLALFGHIMSSDGLKPVMSKIKAITDMPTPMNRFDLDRFLEMVNYLGILIPNLPQEIEPLRTLLNGPNAFQMAQPQLDIVERLKGLITSSIVFLIYDNNLPTLIQTASSSCGLGAMLEQFSDNQWYPIAFASRSLRNAELEYNLDERAYLSLLFGCESFHEYVQGREFFIQSDHENLRKVYYGSISDYTRKIQHIYLKLQVYNFTLIHSSAEKMVVPKALSRGLLKEDQDENDC